MREAERQRQGIALVKKLGGDPHEEARFPDSSETLHRLFPDVFFEDIGFVEFKSKNSTISDADLSEIIRLLPPDRTPGSQVHEYNRCRIGTACCIEETTRKAVAVQYENHGFRRKASPVFGACKLESGGNRSHGCWHGTSDWAEALFLESRWYQGDRRWTG